MCSASSEGIVWSRNWNTALVVRQVEEREAGVVFELTCRLGQDRLTPMRERVLVGPDRSNDFETGIITPGMHPYQAAARCQGPSQRDQDVYEPCFRSASWPGRPGRRSSGRIRDLPLPPGRG